VSLSISSRVYNRLSTALTASRRTTRDSLGHVLSLLVGFKIRLEPSELLVPLAAVFVTAVDRWCCTFTAARKIRAPPPPPQSVKIGQESPLSCIVLKGTGQILRVFSYMP
jgi:hypothetical protein